jgi:hypothetical protein
MEEHQRIRGANYLIKFLLANVNFEPRLVKLQNGDCNHVHNSSLLVQPAEVTRERSGASSVRNHIYKEEFLSCS